MKIQRFIAGICWGLLQLGLGATEHPNFLVVLADDLGWRDVGFAGNENVDTPHLDALAKAGTLFTQAYASAPNCAPTRACLMTGQYTPRHGIYTVVDDRHQPGSPHHRVQAAESRAELGDDAVTMAEVLRENGYATSMVGMWNLGRGRRGPGAPTSQGFGFSREPKALGFEKDAYHDAAGRYLTEELADVGIDFIRASGERPWFLYFAPHAVHAPFDPPTALLAKYERIARSGAPIDPAQLATIEALDTALGRILASIEEAEQSERTLVVFTSDNGGTRRYVAPLRGGKGSLYEGGLRVPMVIKGPGVAVQAECPTPVLSMDIYPTLVEAAGLELSPLHLVDGASLWPLLSGRGELERDAVFWHFPSYVGHSGPASAIRMGGFKLIEHFEQGAVELFDLSSDPGEARDLSKQDKDTAMALLDRLHAWQRATAAPRPTAPNPQFDPDYDPPRNRDQRGKGERRKEKGNRNQNNPGR
jgi:arylsulfatase A